VTVRTYPGARHEILNETNRAEVIGELTSWLYRVAASGNRG
jgi:alpha-beta hydrolase superfamily lysophospholipase